MTVTELAEQVRDSNDRLTRAIEKLGDRFDRFQGDVTGRLSAIDTRLSTIDTKLSAIDTSLRWAKWIGGFLAAAALTAIGFTFV